MGSRNKRVVRLRFRSGSPKESLVETLLWEFFTTDGIGGLLALFPLAFIAVFKKLKRRKVKEEVKKGEWLVQTVERMGFLKREVIYEEAYTSEFEAYRRYLRQKESTEW